MKKTSKNITFNCLVLAAGRGEDDPMAREFDVAHKCLLPIKGRPMITRVLETLQKTTSVGVTRISIENENILSDNMETKKYLGKNKASYIQSKDRASTSVLEATRQVGFPLLVTTADHALLTPDIVEDFISAAREKNCDLAVGLVHENTIKKAYPDVKRTYLRFNDGGYSGANLFALMSPESRKVIDFWQHIEKERKKPWKLIGAFGLRPLFKWLTGQLSLANAFEEASQILKAHIEPIILHDAHASIDVDKQSDHDLVESILNQ